ncbi:MAG: hypothetical protein WAO08_00575, partial [Hyphomicrobiaceae bacterium]
VDAGPGDGEGRRPALSRIGARRQGCADPEPAASIALRARLRPLAGVRALSATPAALAQCSPKELSSKTDRARCYPAAVES